MMEKKSMGPAASLQVLIWDSGPPDLQIFINQVRWIRREALAVLCFLCEINVKIRGRGRGRGSSWGGGVSELRTVCRSVIGTSVFTLVIIILLKQEVWFQALACDISADS